MQNCSVCGKNIYFYSYDKGAYAWKIKLGNGEHIKYQCSYTCHRLEEKKIDDIIRKRAKINRVRCN